MTSNNGIIVVKASNDQIAQREEARPRDSLGKGIKSTIKKINDYLFIQDVKWIGEQHVAIQGNDVVKICELTEAICS